MIIKETMTSFTKKPAATRFQLRRLALPAAGKLPYRGHAHYVPLNWTLGHSKRLAKRRKAPCTSRGRRSKEAGVVGKVESSPIGSYLYKKRLKRGRVVICQVDVFPLEVMRIKTTDRKDSSVKHSGSRARLLPKW